MVDLLNANDVVFSKRKIFPGHENGNEDNIVQKVDYLKNNCRNQRCITTRERLNYQNSFRR